MSSHAKNRACLCEMLFLCSWHFKGMHILVIIKVARDMNTWWRSAGLILRMMKQNNMSAVNNYCLHLWVSPVSKGFWCYIAVIRFLIRTHNASLCCCWLNSSSKRFYCQKYHFSFVKKLQISSESLDSVIRKMKTVIATFSCNVVLVCSQSVES